MRLAFAVLLGLLSLCAFFFGISIYENRTMEGFTILASALGMAILGALLFASASRSKQEERQRQTTYAAQVSAYQLQQQQFQQWQMQQDWLLQQQTLQQKPSPPPTPQPPKKDDFDFNNLW